VAEQEKQQKGSDDNKQGKQPKISHPDSWRLWAVWQDVVNEELLSAMLTPSAEKPKRTTTWRLWDEWQDVLQEDLQTTLLAPPPERHRPCNHGWQRPWVARGAIRKERRETPVRAAEILCPSLSEDVPPRSQAAPCSAQVVSRSEGSKVTINVGDLGDMTGMSSTKLRAEVSARRLELRIAQFALESAEARTNALAEEQRHGQLAELQSMASDLRTQAHMAYRRAVEQGVAALSARREELGEIHVWELLSEAETERETMVRDGIGRDTVALAEQHRAAGLRIKEIDVKRHELEDDIMLLRMRLRSSCENNIRRQCEIDSLEAALAAREGFVASYEARIWEFRGQLRGMRQLLCMGACEALSELR